MIIIWAHPLKTIYTFFPRWRAVLHWTPFRGSFVEAAYPSCGWREAKEVIVRRGSKWVISGSLPPPPKQRKQFDWLIVWAIPFSCPLLACVLGRVKRYCQAEVGTDGLENPSVWRFDQTIPGLFWSCSGLDRFLSTKKIATPKGELQICTVQERGGWWSHACRGRAERKAKIIYTPSSGFYVCHCALRQWPKNCKSCSQRQEKVQERRTRMTLITCTFLHPPTGLYGAH